MKKFNEIEVLKELNKLNRTNALPEELLRKKGLNGNDVEEVVLSIDDFSGVLEVGFVCSNGYDGYNINYEAFDNVLKYLDKSIFDLHSAVDSLESNESTLPKMG